MLCPKCKVEMSPCPLGGQEVDQCPDCRGMWFDAGELAAIRQLKRRSSAKNKTLFLREGDVLDLLCPRCEEASLEVGRAEAFRVERCMDCRGIFLDGDEITKLLEGWKSVRKRENLDADFSDEDFNAAVFAAIYPAIF